MRGMSRFSLLIPRIVSTQRAVCYKLITAELKHSLLWMAAVL